MPTGSIRFHVYALYHILARVEISKIFLLRFIRHHFQESPPASQRIVRSFETSLAYICGSHSVHCCASGIVRLHLRVSLYHFQQTGGTCGRRGESGFLLLFIEMQGSGCPQCRADGSARSRCMVSSQFAARLYCAGKTDGCLISDNQA